MKIPFVGKKFKGNVEIQPHEPKPKKVDIDKLSGMERMKLRRQQYIDRMNSPDR